MTNYGGSAAHEVNLRWDRPLLNSKGETVRFTSQEGSSEIPVLMPNESISTLIDGSKQMFQKCQDMNYTGLVEFKDASRKRMSRHPFYLSIEKYRKTLYFSEEDPKTQYELQKIPEEIRKLSDELHEVRTLLKTKAESRQSKVEG